MGRYLLLLVILFVLYWMLKGTLRRFLAPPRRTRRRARAGADARERVKEPARRPPGIDYSKIKDADYRDL